MSKALTPSQKSQIKQVLKNFHNEVDAVVAKHRKIINQILEKNNQNKQEELRKAILSKK